MITKYNKFLNSEKVNEYLNNDIIYLKKFINMSDEDKKESLVYEFYYLFNDFLETNFEDVYDQYADDMDSIMSYDDIKELGFDDMIIDEFKDDLFNKVMHHELSIPESDYPSWVFLDAPRIIKKQWLVHFTDDANSIASSGFDYGVADMSRLGLTCHLGDDEKKYGGYNFAFTPYELTKRDGEKYGNEFVIFQASGIQMYHNGDEEEQVIFWGNSATNIIPVTNIYGDWTILSKKTSEPIIQKEDYNEVIEWVINNYEQYRKQI